MLLTVDNVKLGNVELTPEGTVQFPLVIEGEELADEVRKGKFKLFKWVKVEGKLSLGGKIDITFGGGTQPSNNGGGTQPSTDGSGTQPNTNGERPSG